MAWTLPGSPRFKLFAADIWKVVVGASIAAAGLFLADLSAAIAGLDLSDMGAWGGVLVVACQAAVNTLKRLLADYSK